MRETLAEEFSVAPLCQSVSLVSASTKSLGAKKKEKKKLDNEILDLS